MPADKSLLDELQKLQSNKTLLQLQLDDLTELIEVREEELALLREKAKEAARLKSVLDNAIGEIEMLQESIDEGKKDSYEQIQFAEMEKELFSAIKEKQQFEKALHEHKSVAADLKQAEDELGTAMEYFTKNRQLKEQLSLTTSNLELAELEIEDLKILNTRLQQQISILTQSKGDN